MNTIDDDALMAFLDGELDADARAEVERAIAADPALGERLRQQQALRARVQDAYAPVLDEPMPERLLAAARRGIPSVGSAPVLEFAAARERRGPGRRPGGSWPQWLAMAASLAIGIVVGRVAFESDDPFVTRDGTLVARGRLADALTAQLASAPADAGPVSIGISFVGKSGRYCRSFVWSDEAPLAGLACRDGERWSLRLLVPAARGESAGPYRMAGTALPPALLRAIDEQIDGQPLDAAAERDARERGWRR